MLVEVGFKNEFFDNKNRKKTFLTEQLPIQFIYENLQLVYDGQMVLYNVIFTKKSAN